MLNLAFALFLVICRSHFHGRRSDMTGPIMAFSNNMNKSCLFHGTLVTKKNGTYDTAESDLLLLIPR